MKPAVSETPEKKFLPTSYVVNSWDLKTGALRSSTAFHHTWQRVEGFELPQVTLVVDAGGASRSAEARPLEARTLTLTNHQLTR